jgi:hypothetical protein
MAAKTKKPKTVFEHLKNLHCVCTNCHSVGKWRNEEGTPNFVRLLDMTFCLTCWRKIVAHFKEALV